MTDRMRKKGRRKKLATYSRKVQTLTKYSLGISIAKDPEAIILAAGKAWRLKPDTWIPKPLLEIGGVTLLNHQISWLEKHGFKKITVVVSQELMKHLVRKEYNFSGEAAYNWILQKRIGTASAINSALDMISGSRVYILNVDDLITGDYSPHYLIERAGSQSAILLSKAKLPFGLVNIRNKKAISFVEKPALDYWTSAGHYSFNVHLLRQYCPIEGDIEKNMLPVLARDRKLNVYKLKDNWYTVNTMKDYIAVNNAFRK